MALVDLKGELIQALQTNSIILEWVHKVNGIPNISYGTTPTAVMPSIIVYGVYNSDGEFADDEPFSSNVRYQVTLFAEKGIPTKVVDAVDKSIRTLGFTRSNYFDLYHDSTRTFQAVLLFDAEPTF